MEVTMKKKLLLGIVLLSGAVTTQIKPTIPKGSYQHTCKNISYNNNQLKAQCRWRDMSSVFGGQKDTTLNLKNPLKYADIITGYYGNLVGISTKNGCATLKKKYNGCSNCTCTGNYLYCNQCSGEGETLPDFIYLTQDNQSIISTEGSLTYEFTPAPNHSTNLPRGSYLQSCGNCTIKNNVLSCMCGKNSSDIISPVKVTFDLSKTTKESFLSYSSYNQKLESSSLPPGNYGNYNNCRTCHVKNNILTCPKCSNETKSLKLDISGMSGSETVSYLTMNVPSTYIFGGQLAITNQTNLPPGNYKQSCGNCTVKNNILSCTCTGTVKKLSEPYTLKLSTVPKGATIENLGNKLIPTLNTPLPAGSYLGSCNNCFISLDNVLTCKCKTGGRGGHKSTTLNLDTVRKGETIGNSGGNLKIKK
jgi:hypothetical protein